MTLLSLLFVSVSAFGIGILSGWLGVGGGLLLIPLVSQWLPWVLGEPILTMPLVTGAAAVQNLAGSGSSALVHWRGQRIVRDLILWSAPAMLVGNYVGASTSGRWEQTTLLLILAFCLLTTWVSSSYKLWRLVSKAKTYDALEMPGLSQRQKWGLLLASLATGLICGTIGVGGAIFLLPLLMYAFKVPVRLAVGSTAFLVFLGAIAAVSGKAQSGLVPLEWSLVITVCALAGGWVGGKTHNRLSPVVLRSLHLSLLTLALGTTLYGLWQAL